MSDKKNCERPTNSLNKVFIFCGVAMIGALIYNFQSTFYEPKDELNSKNLPVMVANQGRFIASDAFDLLDEKGDQSITLSIEDLEAKLTTQFKRHVFLKNIKGTALYLAVIGDEMFFVDDTGSYLLDGRLLDLNNSLILSDLLQEEINSAQRHFTTLRSARLKDVSSFVSSNQVKEVANIQLTQSSQELNKNKNNSTSLEDVTRKNGSPTETKAASISTQKSLDLKSQKVSFAELPMGLNQEINIAPVLLNMASSLSSSDPLFSDKCLTVSLGANSYAEMYHLYQKMKSQDVRRKCGEVYASKLIPQLEDKDLIVYEAPNATRSITILSDYTCQYCRKLHNETQQYLDAGVTVRVFPYGRASYMKGGELTAVGKNNSLALCQTPEKRGDVFDELLSNPTMYNTRVIGSEGVSVPSERCNQRSFIYKVLGDILTHKQTPIVISDEGHVARGYFPAQSLLSRWGML
ncbi:hypothetical protein GNP82_08715 [Aliivibrio fischeri]|uniref:disulfide isomerase DsbC N-terminal domain-containing protein n=1 Tax=Aliivibrio fischeri TaxID=668 RepID=UPI0012D87193|nr:disulfide isomerase DsbC N-terminal domain-containing protein [Aliivibrio fischeri]MUK37633.1 hypothetical protein [Aliivibrio fischeri]